NDPPITFSEICKGEKRSYEKRVTDLQGGKQVFQGRNNVEGKCAQSRNDCCSDHRRIEKPGFYPLSRAPAPIDVTEEHLKYSVAFFGFGARARPAARLLCCLNERAIIFAEDSRISRHCL